jgi:predicted outer membrane repeat protein
LLYNAALHYGGGICEDHSADTEPGSRAEDNLFEGNYADYGGGALYVAGGAPVYEGNTIHANHAGFAGGGILSEHSDLVLQNNEICHNFGPGYAGGGMQSRDGAAVIADNVFHDNSASAGAAGGGLFY